MLNDGESLHLSDSSDLSALQSTIGEADCTRTKGAADYKPGKIDTYFDALSDANDALVQLVENPTAADQRKKLFAAFSDDVHHRTGSGRPLQRPEISRKMGESYGYFIHALGKSRQSGR